jgi:hypothetical protein
MMDFYYTGRFTIVHWVSFAVMAALILFPLGRILRRLGFSPYLSLLAFIPAVNLIALWVLALADWPSSPNRSNPPS